MIQNNSAFIGYKIRFWLYSAECNEEFFEGNCLGIIHEGETYFYMVAFEAEENSEVLGIALDDIKRIKRLRKIKSQLTVVPLKKDTIKTDC
jgi:hypothetical protein